MTDLTGELITSKNPVHQGELVILWFTGLTGNLAINSQTGFLEQTPPLTVNFGVAQFGKDLTADVDFGLTGPYSQYGILQAKPSWVGESPQVIGLDQMNVIFPSCQNSPATIEKHYDAFMLYGNGGSGNTVRLYLPFIVRPGDPDCFKPSTTTTLTASPQTPTIGQAVTFTATVSPSNASGAVTFSIDGTTAATQPLSAGVSTFSTSSLSVGAHTIIATYNGNDESSSGKLQVTVVASKITTTTTLTSNPNPSAASLPVTFTASVSPSNATGTVTFWDTACPSCGSGAFGNVTLVNGKATATTTLSPGTYTITATYNGDTNYNSSVSAPLIETVNQQASTTTTVSFGPTLGGAILTAVVSPPTASGTVRFFDGAVQIGSANLLAQPICTSGSGQCVETVVSLTPGSHSITANYAGNTIYSGSTSAPITVNGSSVTLTSNPNPSSAGQTVTLTATVSPSTASGTVEFVAGAYSPTCGASAPCPLPIDCLHGISPWINGQVQCIVNSPAGTTTFSAVYSGDKNYAGSSGTLTQTIKSTSGDDTTPPTLRALAFTPTTINTSGGSANVNVNFSVTDDLSGVASISVGFMSPSGQQQVFATPDSSTWAKGSLNVATSAIATFPKYYETGTWTVWHVALYDVVGNSAYILPSQLSAMGLPTQITVVGAGDVTPPTLRALSFSATTISTSTAAASVTVGFTVTDDISGVASISVGFMSPSGQQQVFATPDATWPKGALNVTTSGVATFPKNSETGTWTVWHVALYDVVGNSAYMVPSQLAAMGFPTQITVH